MRNFAHWLQNVACFSVSTYAFSSKRCEELQRGQLYIFLRSLLGSQWVSAAACAPTGSRPQTVPLHFVGVKCATADAACRFRFSTRMSQHPPEGEALLPHRPILLQAVTPETATHSLHLRRAPSFLHHLSLDWEKWSSNIMLVMTEKLLAQFGSLNHVSAFKPAGRNLDLSGGSEISHVGQGIFLWQGL